MIKTISFLLLLVLMVPLCQSIEANLTAREQATICLTESEKILNEMQNESFSILRVNDSLKEAKTLFERNKFLEEKKGEYDFSQILPYCEEITKIKQDAFEARDALSALKEFYNEFLTDEMNKTSADILIEEIEKELKNERYEKTKPLIEEAYKEIVDIETSHTTINLVYRTTTKNLKDFFIKKWIYLVSSLLLLSILFLIYKKTIYQWWIKKQISNLESRKELLRKLIMSAQKDYFENNSMSESVYEIKTKKFAELIRDIDRQIPLLKESISKLVGLEKADKIVQKLQDKKSSKKDRRQKK